jgi:hypothetical protein
MIRKNYFQFLRLAVLIVLAMVMLLPATSSADGNANEDLYRKLLNAADTGGTSLFTRLNEQARHLDWDRAYKTHFTGNLRVIKSVKETGSEAEDTIYLLRKLTGELYILSVPADPSERNADADSPYADLDGISGSKMIFNVSTIDATIDGQTYLFALLTSRPEQMKLDRIFKLSIILMLFFVMVGMGMTLTFKEFTFVFREPRGIIFSKLFRINNYQTRAISLETGLRNSALAMTIALLIQDPMGDYYSAMFGTSGLFGLVMYLAGMISIFLYRPLLPVDT